MGKLCRIYMSGLGHAKARFHELTLDFCNPAREPMDSVLFLRNGGGKTSLISLFYSVFLPDRGAFLGKKNQSKRSFDEYVTTNRPGCILVELSFPAQGGHRRIFVVEVMRREKDNEAQRVFYSFLANSGYGTSWDELPAGAARADGSLLLHVREAHKAAPSKVELAEISGQGNWRKHLESVHFDPAVLRHHLRMNSEEGGVVDLFRHTDPRDFARLFLELVLEPESLYSAEEKASGEDKLTAQMQAFRTKVRQEPATRLAAGFCAAVEPILLTMQEEIRRRTGLEEELQRTETHTHSFARSVRDHLGHLEAQLARTEAEVEEKQQARANALNAERENGDWRQTAEHHVRRLRLQEAQAAVGAETIKSGEKELHLGLLEAAVEFRKRETLQKRCAGLEAEIARANEQREPELKRLREIGSRYHRALQLALNETSEERADALSRQTELRAQAKSMALEATGLERLATAAKTKADNLQERVDEAAQRVVDLRRRGLLKERETSGQAAARWAEEASRQERRRDLAHGEFMRLRGELEATRARAGKLSVEITVKNAEEERVSAELQDFDTEWRQLGESIPLRTVAAGAELSPWNSALPAGLANGRDERRIDLVRLVLAAQADRLRLEGYREGGIFPAPSDLQAVIQQLKRVGVQGAIPLYEYLDQMVPAPERTALLRRQPAAWSGILLQNDEDFLKAEAVVAAACERPVVVVSRTFFSGQSAGVDDALRVVLPEETGYWDRQAAASALPDLRRRNLEAQRRKDDLEAEITQWSEAHAWLLRLIKRCPETHVSGLRAQLETLAAVLTQLRDSLERAEQEQESFAASVAEKEREKTQAEQSRSVAAQNVSETEMVWRNHEQPAENWRGQIEQSRLDAERDEARSQRLREDEARFQEEANMLQGPISEQGARIHAWQHEVARLPLDYYDPAATPVLTDSLDALRNEFQLKRVRFDGEFSLTKAAGELAVLQSQLAEGNARYRTMAKGHDAAQIEIEAIEDLVEQNRDSAKLALTNAKAAVLAAETRKNEAKAALDRSRRSDVWPPGKLPPSTAEEAEALAGGFRARAEEARAKIRELDDMLGTLRTKVVQLSNGDIPRYATMLDTLKIKRAAVDEAWPPASTFTGVPDTDNTTAQETSRRVERLRGDIRNVTIRVENCFSDQIKPQATKGNKDDRPPLLDKYLGFVLADIEQRIDERIAEIRQARDAAQGVLNSIESDRQLIVMQLDQRADVAERRLSALERASRMPATIPEWAGKPFLSVRLQVSRDPIERKQRLGALLTRWVMAGVDQIPDGVALAYFALMEVVGDRPIVMKILKPELRLLPVAHDIGQLHKFSGGEKVTAAILLYAVLVRYRAQYQGEGDLLGADAGFLLLDNPFGQVTLLELIGLQVRVARLMGLQLIFATGVADFRALSAFPHHVLLRNTGYDLKTGDRFITPDPNAAASDAHRLSGAMLGEHVEAAPENER